LITETTTAFINVYSAYKLGMLPNEGSWLRQPYRFTEAMRIIDLEVNRLEAENIKQARKTKP